MSRGQVGLKEVEFPKMVIECGSHECPYGGTFNHTAHRHFTYEDYTFAIARNEEIVEHAGPSPEPLLHRPETELP